MAPPVSARPVATPRSVAVPPVPSAPPAEEPATAPSSSESDFGPARPALPVPPPATPTPGSPVVAATAATPGQLAAQIQATVERTRAIAAAATASAATERAQQAAQIQATVAQTQATAIRATVTAVTDTARATLGAAQISARAQHLVDSVELARSSSATAAARNANSHAPAPTQDDVNMAALAMNAHPWGRNTGATHVDVPAGYRAATPEECHRLLGGRSLEDPNSGFAANLFVGPNNDYVLAFRGTDFGGIPQGGSPARVAAREAALARRDAALTSRGAGAAERLAVTDEHSPLSSMETRDALTNLRNGRGLETQQYDEAQALARELVSHTGSSNVRFTGLSLGGGLATAAALATGRDAVIFNAPSIARPYIDAHHGAMPNVRGFNLVGDPVSMGNEATDRLQAAQDAASLAVGPLAQLAPEGTVTVGSRTWVGISADSTGAHGRVPTSTDIHCDPRTIMPSLRHAAEE